LRIHRRTTNFPSGDCALLPVLAQGPLNFDMKKEKSKISKAVDAHVLEILKKVLPKAVDDAALVDRIYEAVAVELQSKAKAKAFEQFCARVELPNLEPKTVMDVKQQLASSFGGENVTLTPNVERQSVAVEVTLPDGSEFSQEVKVRPVATDADEDPEANLKFVPLPVCLPGDKELVWLLAKRETMTSPEAEILLSKLQDDFWGSKTGQKLLRDRVERSFPEFIARVPSGMLSEVGLKRHYKTPEALQPLRNGPRA
jgi:hypothetical protein